METINNEQNNAQKKTMEEPVLRIVRIDDSSVIATSGPAKGPKGGAFEAIMR